MANGFSGDINRAPTAFASRFHVWLIDLSPISPFFNTLQAQNLPFSLLLD